jgi:hypothetical protein
MLRLSAGALATAQLPIDVQISSAADPAGLGDARLCRGINCAPIAVSLTLYAVGTADGDEVPGQITFIAGRAVDPAQRSVFVGWVQCHPLSEHQADTVAR